ncbi:MAG: hypothetical protein WCP96_02360 [Methylococcaceae bacterium]
MNEKKYFLPIKSVNLAHYMSKGCICPANYLKNRSQDIQTKFENCLLLSNTKFTDQTNCALEIIFNNPLEEPRKISENFFLFDSPLPISRIKKIIFQDEKKKITTSFNISSGAAFLPDNLVEIDSSLEATNSNQISNLNLEGVDKDWNTELELFDKLLGGFSLMSIAGNEYQNYPLNYFNTLSVINSLIKKEFINQAIPVNNDFEWAIINTSKHGKLHNTIYSKIDANIIEEFARKDSIALEKNNGKYMLDKIPRDSKTYLVAILASYGDGARLTIDNFISDFVSNKFPDEKKEGIALIFGINKGYEAFRNKYKTENFEVDIKFKLDSQLDYYTIESIYQFVFNNKKDNYSFDYIDNWCVKLKENILRDDCETYQVLDKTISYKKKEKVVSQYLFQQFFQNFEKDFEEYTRLIFDKVKEQFEKTIQSQANEIFKLKENIEKLNLELKNSQETIQSRTNEIFKLNEKIDQQLGAILFPLEIGRQGLEKMNITKLKEEAKKMQIKNLHTFKNTPEGKDKLIAIMLQMESDKLKP